MRVLADFEQSTCLEPRACLVGSLREDEVDLNWVGGEAVVAIVCHHGLEAEDEALWDQVAGVELGGLEYLERALDVGVVADVFVIIDVDALELAIEGLDLFLVKLAKLFVEVSRIEGVALRWE